MRLSWSYKSHPSGLLGLEDPLEKDSWASLVAQTVKNLPGMWETWLGRSHRGRHGNPLQYSCLENPYGQRGGLQATVHEVAKSRTQLATKEQQCFKPLQANLL